MTMKTVRASLWGTLLLAVIAADAQAWGPKAQRAITLTAIQRIQERYPNAFQYEESRYQADVVNGAVDYADTLGTVPEIRSQQDAYEAIANEVALLREMRKYGVGSYFAYRMGRLSALVSDTLLPFALDSSPQAEQLRDAIIQDIENAVGDFRFFRPEGGLREVNAVSRYIEAYRPFGNDARRMIAADYGSGRGYDGYLRNAAPKFFGNAIQAAADVWATVLQPGRPSGIRTPSAEAVTAYVVDEMDYLLNTKNNPPEALEKYPIFQKVNPGLAAAYERVGDLIHNYGAEHQDSEMLERAVTEWQLAMDLPDADRRSLSRKIASHYLAVGRAQAEAAEQPGGYKLIGDAIAAFTRALEYDRDSGDAERLLARAQVRKRELDEAFNSQKSLIDSAQQVVKQAEKSVQDSDFSNALITYAKASNLFSQVTDQFPELKEAADAQVESVEDTINDIKQQQIDRAEELIEQGDEALETKQFDNAIQIYESVTPVLQVITDDAALPHGKRRDELMAEKDRKIDEAKRLKAQWEQEQQALQNQPGGAPAAPAAPPAPGGFGGPAAPGGFGGPGAPGGFGAPGGGLAPPPGGGLRLGGQ